jgi:hypothetical protein
MRYWLIFFLLATSTAVTAQDSTEQFVYPFQLSPTQQTAWKKIIVRWNTEVFAPYIKKHKIKPSNCATCGALYLNVDFAIDSSGILNYTIYTTSKCGKKMSTTDERTLTQFFKQLIIPKALYNLKIKEQLGVLLKC